MTGVTEKMPPVLAAPKNQNLNIHTHPKPRTHQRENAAGDQPRLALWMPLAAIAHQSQRAKPKKYQRDRGEDDFYQIQCLLHFFK